MKFANHSARRHLVSPGILLGLAFVALSPGAKASTYNAVDDFSIVSNPNGPWSYLASGTPLSTSGHNFGGGQSGWDYWWSAQPVPTSEAVFKNVTGSPTQVLTIVLPPGYLGMDPESASNVDVRFIVPSTGTYSISGNFLGIDTNEQSHPVEILDGGGVIFNSIISSYGQTDMFSLSETLSAGTVLDFENLTGSTFSYLSTGLDVTIASATATPEPQAYMMITAGLAFVAFGIWRKRTRSQQDALHAQPS